MIVGQVSRGAQKIDLGVMTTTFDDLDAAGRPDRPSASGPIEVIDLFCGCGGLSYGFEVLGRLFPGSFRLAGAADIDADAVATYAANLPVQPVMSDLSLSAGDSAASARFLEQFCLTPGAARVVIGGPPCQGFSAHRKKDRHEVDRRNSLVTAFAEVAVAASPDFILMENVPELLSEKHWDLFSSVEALLSSAGYTVRARVFNLAHFGVPQERFRAIVMASRRPFQMPEPLLEADQFWTVRDAIGHLPIVDAGEVAETDPLHVSAKHRNSTLEVIRAVKKNGGNRPKGMGPECLDRVDGFRDVYGRLSWDRPSNTITAYARNPASGRFVHPEQDRGLTVREAALLQGFPQWFGFSGSFDAKFSQVGNAVPPRFSVALAAHVLGQLQNENSVAGEPTPDDVDGPLRNSFSSSLAGLKYAARVSQ